MCQGPHWQVVSQTFWLCPPQTFYVLFKKFHRVLRLRELRSVEMRDHCEALRTHPGISGPQSYYHSSQHVQPSWRWIIFIFELWMKRERGGRWHIMTGHISHVTLLSLSRVSTHNGAWRSWQDHINLHSHDRPWVPWYVDLDSQYQLQFKPKKQHFVFNSCLGFLSL